MDFEKLTGMNRTGVVEDKTREAARRSVNADLDKDAFLRLLVTELQYQDPLNPMEDKAFIAEMAQFTALEQMQNMNKAYAQSQGCSLIGKEINAVNGLSTDGTDIHGIVEAVVMKNSSVYVKVGEDLVPVEGVREVRPAAPVEINFG
jgi:flagellar basal-body rod modification protein FlgD